MRDASRMRNLGASGVQHAKRKSRDGRTASCRGAGGAVRQILLARRARAVSSWVFPGRNPSKPMTNPKVGRIRLLERAGLMGPHAQPQAQAIHLPDRHGQAAGGYQKYPETRIEDDDGDLCQAGHGARAAEPGKGHGRDAAPFGTVAPGSSAALALPSFIRLGRTMNRPFILPCWVFVPRDCGRECVSLSWFKALHNQEHAIHVRRADQHAERRGAQAARGSDPTRSAVRFNERARIFLLAAEDLLNKEIARRFGIGLVKGIAGGNCARASPEPSTKRRSCERPPRSWHRRPRTEARAPWPPRSAQATSPSARWMRPLEEPPPS